MNEKKIQELRTLYAEVNQALTKYGLNNHGSAVHTKVEEALTEMREEFKRLKPKDEDERLQHRTV